jgi:hypothetical protein
MPYTELILRHTPSWSVTFNLTKLLQLNTKPRRKKGGQETWCAYREKAILLLSIVFKQYGIHSNNRIFDIGTSLTLLT